VPAVLGIMGEAKVVPAAVTVGKLRVKPPTEILILEPAGVATAGVAEEVGQFVLRQIGEVSGRRSKGEAVAGGGDGIVAAHEIGEGVGAVGGGQDGERLRAA
jgi:hypothetical protein